MKGGFQTYEHILGNIYTVPEEISENAKEFISKLLHPDPQERGDLEPTSIDSIFSHKFLKTCPKQLPESKKKDIQEWKNWFISKKFCHKTMVLCIYYFYYNPIILSFLLKQI